MKSSFKIAALCMSFALSGIGEIAQAQGLARGEAIRFVVPYAPGGSADQITRVVASEMSKNISAPIVVDNKPGAAGILAAEHVAKSAPDGRTFFVGSNAPLVINTALYRSLPYKPESDFLPIGGFAKSPLLLVTRKDLPVNSLAELAALGKASPGKITMGSAGSGNITHLAGEYASGLMGMKVTHVPFNGSAPAITSMLGGNIDIMFDALPSSMQHAKAGRIKAFAIMDNKRFPALPDIPTLRELGYENTDASAWFGLVAPAKTPREVIERLNKAINESLANPEVQAKLRSIGTEPIGGTPEEFAAFIKSERKRWIPVVKATGATAD